MPNEYDVAEIKQKHKIVYQVDLKNDIDHEKNPQNEIKYTEEYLEFICENGRDISINELETFFGRLEKKEGYLEGIVGEAKHHFPQERIERSDLFHAVSLVDLTNTEYDIFNISFSRKTEQVMIIYFINEFHYQINMDFIKGVFASPQDEDYVKRITSPQNKALGVSFNQKNSLNVHDTRTGIFELINFKYSLQQPISFCVDYKLGKVNIDGQKWATVSMDNFEKLNHFAIQCKISPNASSFEDNFHIYKLRFAKNKGYIYLKPIILQKGEYKLFLQYTGEISLEYSKDSGSNWAILTSHLGLNKKENLSFRLKMNSGDKLHDFFIANCK